MLKRMPPRFWGKSDGEQRPTVPRPTLSGFDTAFDDARWNAAALDAPLVQVPPGEYSGGYRVVRRAVRTTELFGVPYQALRLIDCRALLMPDGTLWMSDVPQERMMMANNADRSFGSVLVGGLGLAVYPQYLGGSATHLTIVERSATVVQIAEPVLREALEQRVDALPCDVIVASIETYLTTNDGRTFDTVFLDTWDRLDPLSLPEINVVRDLARRRLRPGGRVLAWGYRWMVRMFLTACEPLLTTPLAHRHRWLDALQKSNPAAYPLLAAATRQLDLHGDLNIEQARRYLDDWICMVVPGVPPSA